MGHAVRRRIGPVARRLVLAAGLSVATLEARAGCKLALALALDTSASVDKDEARLQFDGLASALTDPRVVEAILTPAGDHIQVAVFEWSGYSQQLLIVDWTYLDSIDAIRTTAERLRNQSRAPVFLATAIGKAVEFGGRLLRISPPCTRQVLDVSGDGVGNIGAGPRYFYERGDLNGAVVNGLVIRGADPDPLTYYRTEVIFGPGAFVEIADDYTDFRRAMVRKLLREIDPQMILGER